MWASLLIGSASAAPYALSLSEDQLRQRLDHGIEAAIANMGLLERPLARFFLRRDLEVCPAIELEVTGEWIRWRCRTGPEALAFERRLDGAPELQWFPRHGEVLLSATGDATRVVVRAESERGTSVEVYRFLSDGTVILETTVTSPRLLAPLRWQVEYAPER